MDNYLRIARVYVRGAAAAVWLFLFLCLLACLSLYGEIAGNQVGILILGGILSPKSYLAMFAYFNACVLGVLLRDNIAHPWASLLPHYRKKHLVVTTLIALFFLGIPMFAMEFVGTSDIAPTSVAVIFLSCLAAGLWTLHHPAGGFLAFPFVAFVIFVRVPLSDPDLADFLAGKNLPASAGLVFISLVALWALAWRLLALNEDRVAEYGSARVWGDFLRGRGMQTFRGQAKTIDDYLAALPADKRAALQIFDEVKKPLFNLKQVDNLSGHRERSLWQRLLLWRLGNPPRGFSGTIALLFRLLFNLMLLAALVYLKVFPGQLAVLVSSVWVISPFEIWALWANRDSRLGYESLRPRTREQFFRELGLAFLWDIVERWLWGVLCTGIAAAIWAPELLQVKNIIFFLLCTGAAKLCGSALGIWPLKRGILANGVWYRVTTFVVGLCLLVFLSVIGLQVYIASAAVLAAASVGIIALTYHRWLRADLN